MINIITRAIAQKNKEVLNMEAKIVGISNEEIIFCIPSSRDGFHFVTYDRILGAWTCTCEHYQFRGGYCRHMKISKELLANLNETVQNCTDTAQAYL